MSIHTQPWEAPLLTWAYTALEDTNSIEKLPAQSMALAAAYHRCEAITSEYSRTFFLASGLLPAQKRLAVRALYAFCRVTDDIVDETPDGDRLAALERWRVLALSAYPPADEPVALAWADARARYGIPLGYAEQLICGVARDLIQSRYQTFADLAAYSYGVASTVGLMAMHIIGFTHEDAIPYAVKLGVALQLTNILRDVGADWRLGRLYLPQDELAAFGLDDDDIGDAQIDGRWHEFMRFQIARNRQLYDEGLPGIALLNLDGRFAIAAAAELYRAILVDIEQHQHDVFARRAHVTTMGKLRRLPRIWWQSRTVGVKTVMSNE